MKTKKKKTKKKNIKWLKLRLWFVSVVRPLRYIFLLSTVFVLGYEFWLSDFTDQFSTVGKHLINFIAKLSYSYISAFIFYLLAVHTPKHKRKVKMILHISNTTSYLLTELRYFHETFHSYTNIQKKVKSSELSEILNKHSPYSEVKSKSENLNFQNWFYYYEWKALRVQKLIDNILDLYDFFSPEFTKYLVIIRSSFENVNMIYHQAKGSPNMAFFGLIFHDLEYNIEQLKHQYKQLLPFTELYHDEIRKENRSRWAAEAKGAQS